MKPSEIFALTPAGTANPAIAVAAGRAGAVGLLDLEHVPDLSRATEALKVLRRFGTGGGLLLDGRRLEMVDALLGDALRGMSEVVFTGAGTNDLARWIPAAHDLGLRAWVEVIDGHGARDAEDLGADGLIAKGNEAGGWVSSETTFILLQRLLAEAKAPVLARGGIGLHSAAACVAGGAAGVVLDTQLLLTREGRLSGEVAASLARTCGDETAVSRAADLARRYHTVGGIVTALPEAVDDHLRAAQKAKVFAEGSPLAASHGTRFPIVQGPMSRVSDRPEFAKAVADEGALPCLAVGLMSGREADEVMRRTADLLGAAPWGVGLMGFLPREVWDEQMKAVVEHRPAIAVIAGGRPDQAARLEREGIAAYLHAPTPGLLRLFLEAGARRFIFEGRECGGHVGPLGSLGLWDAMVEVLLDELPEGDAPGCHVLFAGGIHDARSAAMVAALAAPVVERGVKVGVLLGSAYLFTREAVETGAISEEYLAEALVCRETALVESSPGHAVRCTAGPYVEEFEATKLRLIEEGSSAEETSLALQTMSVGRLGSGLYIVGQLAALRDRATTIARLHEDVCVGGTRVLESLDLRSAESNRARSSSPRSDVAIVGMSCILPGAPDLRTYWANIVNRVCAITEVPPSHWDPTLVYTSDRLQKDRTYSKWGGFFAPVTFDPTEWGMPPNSVAQIDPMQLVALLAAREALRDAGYENRAFDRSRTAVILGVTSGLGELGGLYVLRAAFPLLFGADAWQMLADVGDALPQWTEDSFPGLIANVVAGRISNRLDLTGPNFVVDAACASSLAAVDVALKELAVGEAEMAIVGGVDALQGLFGYYCFSATQAFSPTGRARVFDEAADGLVSGEGCAMLVLKNVDTAERDGDRIHALIRGVDSSSDGRAKGLTAPRAEGQLEALRRAYRRADLSPASVGLFEAHGTGTVAGDRSEAQALAALVEEAGARPRSQAVGSVKSMIGHTKAAAGVSGLVKAILALRHKVLPPTLGVTTPLPGAGFEDGPLYLNTEARPWLQPAGDEPRRAGVSAFGFGGTNFHVVLEEYRGGLPGDDQAACDEWPAELLVWSAASREGLADQLYGMTDQFDRGATPRLRDLALSQWHRAQPRERVVLAVVASSIEDLRAKLSIARDALAHPQPIHDERGVYLSEDPLARDGKIAFVFPGHGSQYPNMLREAAVYFPEVRETFETAEAALGGLLPRPLGDHVFPPPAFTPAGESAQREALTAANIAQPALGAACMGMHRLLGAFGVRPDMVAGHSFGEHAALAASGRLSEADLARLAEARGRFLIEAFADAPGAMAAVQAGESETASALEGLDDVWIANVNAPTQTVISGAEASIETASERLSALGLRVRRLGVAGAFHTPYVSAALPKLAETLRSTMLHPGSVDLFSNTTAGLYPTEDAEICDLLVRHAVSPVRFAEEIEAMYDAGARVFVEVGPRAVLTALIGQILDGRPHVVVPTDRPDHGGVAQILQALGRLWIEGVQVAPDHLFAGRDARVLDLDRLVEETRPAQPSPTAWLVTGCRAWPAHKPMPVLPIPLVGDAALSLGMTLPEGGDEADEVMARHREFLRRLAETHREVMRWYLDAREPVEETAAPVVEELKDATPTPAGDVADRLLAIVSERTGYPPDMLDLDLHIEADLGIDSIKRVEILGAIQREFLPAGGGLDTEAIEDLIALTTLEQIIAWVEGAVAVGGERGLSMEPAAEEEAPRAATIDAIRRIVLTRVAAPDLPAEAPSFPPGRTILITDDGRGIAGAMAAKITDLGGSSVVVSGKELMDAEAVEGLVARVIEEHGPLCAIVHLLPLAGAPALEAMDLAAWRARLRRDVKSLFYLSRAAGAGLGWLVSAMDPAFPGHGGLAGFVKTAAREWPGVRCKAVGLDPAQEPALLAERLLAEMAADDALVDVAYDDGRRTTTGLEARELGDGSPITLDPGEDWVFLLTGGARGITAEVAHDLARLYHPTLILVGASPMPEAEDPRTERLSSPAEIKPALHALLQSDGGPSGLRDVEAAYARLLRDREIRANLQRLADAGARVEYRQADVRDEAAMTRLVTGVLSAHGRLDVVVHGAGVVEDKLIRDKTPESFDRVFDTKADSVFLLSRALETAEIRVLVLFSSTAGVVGNRGQCDYAAANAILGEYAAYLDGRWPGRVVAQTWGPWARGMVNAEVARELARQGLSLLAPEAGAAMCALDMTRGCKGEAQVVLAAGGAIDAWIGGERPQRSAASPAATALLPLLHGGRMVVDGDVAIEIVRTLDPAQDLYLDDHRLDGRPVLPMTFAVEMMAEAAKQLRPALEVVEIRDFRMLKGVVLRNGPLDVKVSARLRPSANGNEGLAVEVEVSECANPGRPCYQAVVRLSEALPSSPCYAPPANGFEPPDVTAEEAYERYMFHGPLLQGLVRIEGLGPTGAVGVVAGSTPKLVLADAPEGEWLLDPVAFDSGLQLGLVWSRTHLDVTPLPTRFASCKLYGRPKGDTVRCWMEGLRADAGLVIDSNVYFVDMDGRLVAAIEHFEAAGSALLNRLSSRSELRAKSE